ncbi:unnamed protein product [Pedinophyceae sp. YPF-701]|nr:unnamed protein product [Pedinophyceae sp. YPF-701]
MCGILAAYGLTGDPEKNRRLILRLSKLLRHRGPDGNAVYVNAEHGVYLAHERLNIVDVTDHGRQPFTMQTPEGELAWLCNGETYNQWNLRETVLKDCKFLETTTSDSAVVGPLYLLDKNFADVSNHMDGLFATALFDARSKEFFASRDEMGKASMYWGRGADGSVWVSSEMKALQDVCTEYHIFPPGHHMHVPPGAKDPVFQRWFTPRWITDPEYIPTQKADTKVIHDILVKAVVKRLMTDVPFGILLSGGLDSSLVAAIAVKHLKEAEHTYAMKKLKTFSIGLPGAPDLEAARKVADQLGTDHYEFTFSVEDGIDALRDLIWMIESFEQVRAAVPMYLLSRKIKAMGTKMVLSGEGADEIFGGYLYFHKAPSAEEFHKETVRKTSRLHQWDVLRANKSTFAWGLEARVPFLDRDFLNYCMDVDAADKMIDMSDKPDGVHPRMEKYLLRKAFDTPDDPYLPAEVLWRQKEQFSDGVGYNWVDGLKEYCHKVVTDDMWAKRAERFPEHTPRTREYYHLRDLFEQQFPGAHALETIPKGLSVACSTPEAVSWDPEWENLHEISGRAVKVHDSSHGFKSMDAINGAPKVSPAALA